MDRSGSFDDMVREIYLFGAENDPSATAEFGIELLERRVGFDTAWFGWASLSATETRVRASATRNLPGRYSEFWSEIAQEDILAKELRDRQVPTIGTYNRRQRRQTEGMVSLCEQFGIDRMACSISRRPQRSTSFFCSVYRSGARARDWSQSELHVIKTVAGHIQCAMQAHVRHRGSDRADARLLFDCDGHVVLGFAQLKRNLPGLLKYFQEDCLTSALWQKLKTEQYVALPGTSLAVGLTVAAEAMGLRPATVRKRRQLDELTPREQQVARLLAKGWTAGRIADELGTRRTTVRNQTQSIYSKLAVGRRAELTKIVVLEEGSGPERRLPSGPQGGFLDTGERPDRGSFRSATPFVPGAGASPK